MFFPACIKIIQECASHMIAKWISGTIYLEESTVISSAV
jgi:hypothetical protein